MRRLVWTLLSLLLLAGPAITAVPYTPSQLLYSPISNGSFAYLLQTTGTSQDATTEFISLNISGSIYTTSPSYNILMDPLPFQLGEQSPAFVPVIDEHGVIKIYAGNCHKALEKAELWRFTPDTNSSTGDGTWGKFAIAESSTTGSMERPNYLAAGFAFSATNTSDSSVYAFGGMCPSSDSSETTWMAKANYSQAMVVLDPPKSNSNGSYGASTAGSRAPPIAEAGFTTTPLQASYAETSSGELRQQQDFLLVGGQTRHAFINMSQLAVFSLPQNSWSFVTVNAASASYKTDLTARDATTIEPRSGHSAVLSPDGSKVIVYGGWVGNTTVAAQPQLAVLELGESYGGSGDWAWSVPSSENSGISQGSGLYGHGATMLPGGVMMVAGGYTIPQLSPSASASSSSSSSPLPSPSSWKRSVTESRSNTQVYLYNITSGKWVSSYQNPYSIASQEDSKLDGTWKIGVGVGVGVGIPVVVGLAILIFFMWKRRQKHRTRDDGIRELAAGAERSHFWGQQEPFMASSMRRPSMQERQETQKTQDTQDTQDTQETKVNSDYPWSSNHGSGKSPVWRDKGEAAAPAERMGLLGDPPSPTKMTPRPGFNTRAYRPPSQYNEYRRSDASDIHPIDEREEDEAKNNGQEMTNPLRGLRYLTPIITSVSREPYNASLAGPSSNVMAGVTGPDRDMPTSPDKDERTSSNLSDSSNSTKSVQRSQMVNLHYPASLSSSGYQVPQKAASVSGYGRDSIRSRPNSGILFSTEMKRHSSDSYSTAPTSFSQRQVDGEYFLPQVEPSSPIDLFPNAPKPRASEWLGNVRRVISLTRRRSTATESTTTASQGSGLERRSTIRSSRPPLPRRSVSASAEVFRRKQGAKDWSAGNRLSANLETRSRSLREDGGFRSFLDLDPDSDEDWDVEGAAEGRRVQVTFTVPKERLRVVNAAAGDLDNESIKTVSRSNSAASISK
ncbi:galactose oxidase [Aspergillus ellipticus CBS 707.79]|uniref:Galactose oxidase n=1 Tax=Aspergillus ellipticus CBS 707.79 TaxID=1448320 RepID=A0A319DP20_9EURO|nr:galactose oxidase [Aspergillus ellipticus CBS 707.79]